jgi:hypothetical protein
MRSWLRWRTKEIGDRNEIAWLYEVVDEQERGIYDNRNLIRKALPNIESEHKRTPEVEALLQSKNPELTRFSCRYPRDVVPR